MLKIPFALRSVFETTCKPDKYAFLKNRSKRNKVDTHTHTHTVNGGKSKYSFCRTVKEAMATVHGPRCVRQ